MGGDLANGFDARLQTQFISSLDWRHNNPPFLYLLLAFRFLLLIFKSIYYEQKTRNIKTIIGEKRTAIK